MVNCRNILHFVLPGSSQWSKLCVFSLNWLSWSSCWCFGNFCSCLFYSTFFYLEHIVVLYIAWRKVWTTILYMIHGSCLADKLVHWCFADWQLWYRKKKIKLANFVQEKTLLPCMMHFVLLFTCASQFWTFDWCRSPFSLPERGYS